VEDSILITVVPINDPPILTPLPILKINESETIEFNLRPYLSDVDNNITNLIIMVDNQNVFISGSGLIIFGSKQLPKELQISVSDGMYTVIGTLRIKVIPKEVNAEDSVSEVVSFFVILLVIIFAIIFTILRYRYIVGQKYDIEEIFLIHNSGKLLNHIYCKTHSKFDDEIFSGMFTAIQEFIEDTFTHGDESDAKSSLSDNFNSELDSHDSIMNPSKRGKQPMKLNEFKVGDNQVIIEHGKYIFMAVVYSGPGTIALHKVIKQSITDIETDFGNKLEYWDGDIKQVAGIKKHLEALLPKEELDEELNKKIKTKFSKPTESNKEKKGIKSVPLKDLQSKLMQ
jgi:hypothetical protein